MKTLLRSLTLAASLLSTATAAQFAPLVAAAGECADAGDSEPGSVKNHSLSSS